MNSYFEAPVFVTVLEAPAFESVFWAACFMSIFMGAFVSVFISVFRAPDFIPVLETLAFASVFKAAFVFVFGGSGFGRAVRLAFLVTLGAGGATTAGVAWPFPEFPWLPTEDAVVPLPADFPLPTELMLEFERLELVLGRPGSLRPSADGPEA